MEVHLERQSWDNTIRGAVVWVGGHLCGVHRGETLPWTTEKLMSRVGARRLETN